MNRSTILLVDDEPDFRANVAAYLSERGYRVLQADSFESALDVARESELDAALLDIQMPGMDGIELLGRLKQTDAHLEIVMITGFASIERGLEAMRRGAFHIFAKPARLAELELTLARAVVKGRLARRDALYHV